MCRSPKLTYEDRQRLSCYAARLRTVLSSTPEAKQLLPKSMHPVLSDLKESVEAVAGFIGQSIELPPK